MATFKQYKLKDGSKKWLFKTYLGIDEVTGKQVTTTRRGFETKKAAVIAEKRLQHDVIENGFNQNKATTFGELYEMWLKQYRLNVKESSVATIISHASSQVLPIFKDIKLDKLTISFCQKTVNEWYELYKNFNYPRMIVNQVLKYGVSLEMIDSNPMSKTALPRKKQQNKNINFYTKAELKNFLALAKEHSPNQHFTFFRLLAYTGMRKSEVLAIQWKDIDFENNLLKIGKTTAVDENRNIIIQTPKTNASEREISLDSGTISVLKEWRKKQKLDYFIYGYNTSSKNQFLFTDKYNKLLLPTIVNQWYSKIISFDRNMKQITPHGFRHTHCSLLFDSGASLQDVQERLGHKDIQTTMNIYTHVTEKSIKKTGDLFARYMEN